MSLITDIKQLRQDGDAIIQRIRELGALPASAYSENQHAITKFQEGVMWLGMVLKALNEPNPYPSSKDPNTGDKIEPTADNLKF
jgi:hypothetical protein